MIRAINQQDREVFLALSREFYTSAAVLHPIPQQYHEDAFNEMMRSDVYMQGYLFEVEGRAAGYALLSKTYSMEAGGRVIWLEELYVTDVYRGCGLAREFLDFMHTHCPAMRYRLEVSEGNMRAMRLYERNGYTVLPYVQMVKE